MPTLSISPAECASSTVVFALIHRKTACSVTGSGSPATTCGTGRTSMTAVSVGSDWSPSRRGDAHLHVRTCACRRARPEHDRHAGVPAREGRHRECLVLRAHLDVLRHDGVCRHPVLSLACSITSSPGSRDRSLGDGPHHVDLSVDLPVGRHVILAVAGRRRESVRRVARIEDVLPRHAADQHPRPDGQTCWFPKSSRRPAGPRRPGTKYL